MLLKHSRTIGIICAAINMVPWVIFAANCIYTLCLPDSAVHFESKGYAYGFLLIFIGPALLISGLGLWGSLIVRKKPTLGAVLMLVSGGMILLLATVWWLAIPSLPLIAAGVLALVSANKTSGVKETQNDSPGRAGE